MARRSCLAALAVACLFAADSAPAAEPVRLRVLCYNIHHAEGTDGKLDLQRIADIIRAAEPDLVALQEVDQNVGRSGDLDQPAELARLTGLHVAFGGNLKYDGGDYGNAVLSRWPVRRKKNHQLPSFDSGEQRGLLEVEPQLPDGHPAFVFCCTHLDHRRPERERVASAVRINEIADHRDLPLILAGDLNAVPDSRPLDEFRKEWTLAGGDDAGPTIPSANPTRRIDYILLRPAARWKVIEVKVLDELIASDHRPVLAILELLPNR